MHSNRKFSSFFTLKMKFSSPAYRISKMLSKKKRFNKIHNERIVTIAKKKRKEWDRTEVSIAIECCAGFHSYAFLTSVISLLLFKHFMEFVAMLSWIDWIYRIYVDRNVQFSQIHTSLYLSLCLHPIINYSVKLQITKQNQLLRFNLIFEWKFSCVFCGWLHFSSFSQRRENISIIIIHCIYGEKKKTTTESPHSFHLFLFMNAHNLIIFFFCRICE